MRHTLCAALLLLAPVSPALAEPVLTCTADGCAWVDEAAPARGVTHYSEHPSTRSIPAELWMPTPRPAAEPAAEAVEPAPSVRVVYLREPWHRQRGSASKPACRARGAYPSACLGSVSQRRRSAGRAVAGSRPVEKTWPVGIPAGFRERLAGH
jgi:hypothetical protein